MEGRMIKIGKKPFIIEKTDRWGRPTGRFGVHTEVGLRTLSDST